MTWWRPRRVVLLVIVGLLVAGLAVAGGLWACRCAHRSRYAIGMTRQEVDAVAKGGYVVEPYAVKSARGLTVRERERISVYRLTLEDGVVLEFNDENRVVKVHHDQWCPF